MSSSEDTVVLSHEVGSSRLSLLTRCCNNRKGTAVDEWCNNGGCSNTPHRPTAAHTATDRLVYSTIAFGTQTSILVFYDTIAQIAKQPPPRLPVAACSQSAPEKYLPAFGGFCSFGVAAEPVWTADTLGPFGDPSKWTISSDGRLHIFRR